MRAAVWSVLNRLRQSSTAQFVMFLVFDLMVVWTSTLLAYFIRFEGVVPDDFLNNVTLVAVVASILTVCVFSLLRLYHQVWRYVGVDVLLRDALGVAIVFALMVAADVAMQAPGGLRPAPLGTLFILAAFMFLGTAGVRAVGRLAVYLQSAGGSGTASRVVIVGAGDAGSLLLRDIENQPELGLRVVGFLDDDRGLRGKMLRGKPVFGPPDLIADLVSREEVDQVFVAIPSLSNADRRRILELCSSAGIATRIITGLAQEGRLSVTDLRKVSVEDLLGREPVRIDADLITGSVEGRVVAVTGAAGSIGSELCRQLVRLRPKRLMLVEIDESRLYEVFLELRETDPDIPVMCLCDIRDSRKLNEVFSEGRPDIVLHAAAYKHVPLMELEPDEAVKTNVSGTWNVITACELVDVDRFTLISTDKAVAPKSVMGLTKAIAERLTLEAARRGRLRTSIVRFGNVLGSRGSVVPLFEAQLRRGGPLLVTHPEVTRFFMTIPEAARLVLQAQAMSAGGEIFVLEMGEPVRIVDLARKMVVLSGVDAEIRFTGLRPAEKMHEVLVHSNEDLIETGCEKVLRLNCAPVPAANLESLLRTLGMFARMNDRAGMKACFKGLMPDFVGEGANLIELDQAVGSEISSVDPDMETLF